MVQPVLWAVMVSLAAVWEAAGVHPDAVVGHSQGEIAAATVAGMLSVEDAALVVAVRSRALSGLGDAGGMVSVVMPEVAVRDLLGRWDGRLAIAAVNGPAQVVVSGDAAALAGFEAELAARRVLRWPVPASDFVAHSPRVAGLEETLGRELGGIQPGPGRVRLFSTVSCGWADGAELDAGYWYANVRQTVQFAGAVGELARAGYGIYIEVSPHPVLTGAVTETIEEAGAGVEPAVSGTLTREAAGARALLGALAWMHVRGVKVDWTAVLGTGQAVELPTYAFQRQRYWPSGTLRLTATATAAAGGDGSGTEAEARFWAAVEGGDLTALAGTLAVDGERPFNEALPQLAAWRRREQDRSVTEGWRYRITWVPVADPDPVPLTGTWLAVVPDGAGAEAAGWCARALEDGGARVIVAETAAAVDRAGLAGLIAQALADEDGPLAGVISLLALDEAPLPAYPVVPAGLAGTLALVHALGDAGVRAPLWVLTQGAVATGAGETLARPVQGMACGLGRVAGLENPERWGGLVDVPAVLDERAAVRLRAVLAGCGEDQVAIRPAGITGRRLARAGQPGRDRSEWRPSGTVLVTGGTGAIAGRVARWAAGRGAARIVLASRSGPAAPRAAGLAAELAAAGAKVEVIGCDMAQRAPAAGLLDWIAAGGPPLSSVLHTAGLVRDIAFEQQTVADLDAVLAAKAAGAALLDELTAGLDLDAFVMFSSIASTWGSGWQAGYAAGNAFLDALAENRRGRGLAATSVAWGAWGGGGMTDDEGAAQLRRRGVLVMDPDLAVGGLGEALAAGETVLTVADVDWARFAATFTLLRPSRLIGDLPEVVQALADVGEDDGPGDVTVLARRLAGLPEAQQDRVLVGLVRAEAAAALGHDGPGAVEPGRAFRDMGFDSLTAVELRNRLSAVTGLRLSATTLFDYPTPVAVADYLRSQVAGAPAQPGAVTVTPASADEPVAIVAIGCRFAGGVRDPEDLWQLLAAVTDAVAGFPADRGWDMESFYDPDPDHPGTSYVRRGGFVHDATEFDPGFFGISPREALAMDPQQRLVLETSWEALERAGIVPASLRGSRTGVFVGAAPTGYGLSGLPEEVEGHLGTGTAGSVTSGRVSYLLGLEGPAVTVDTACSSALVALHLACQAIRAGECSLALAGGVMVVPSPVVFVVMSRQRALSPDGRCKAFGAAADGMGIAEGAGMLVLERLSDAQRNGHPVLAVVRGSAVNQDGASNGLTAPNGPSQQRVIRAALASAGLSPSEVDAVEAHGSGTPLGDPIEAQALLATYGQDRPEGRPLWLGSVKSNIGHAQQAAGVAGVIKMVLALQHEELPGTLHADEPSPYIDWESGAVRLLTEPVPWPAGGQPRRAGVSAFGMSGTNAHVILEEAAEVPAAGDETETDAAGEPAEPRLPLVSGAVPWVVSGRSAAGLAGQARRLAAQVTARPGLDPGDVAWSLAATRSVFEHRAVAVGRDRDDLVAGLGALATGQRSEAVSAFVAGDAGRVAFVFPGQGAQWTGMGRELLGCCPVFASRLAQCGQALVPHVTWDLLDVINGAQDAPALERADVVQPVLWAVMVSLAAVWEAAGVHPEAVIGHSQGEVAAATVAGMLSLEDAARVVAVRSRILSGLGDAGGMVSVVMPEAAVRELLRRWGERLSVAAVNSPASTVVSGELEALSEFETELAARHVMRWRVPETGFVAHSPQVARVEETLARDLAGIQPGPGRTRLLSTALGRWMEGPELDAGYWYANVRHTVRFADAVRELAADGFGTYIEVSPHPTLEAAVAETIEDAGAAFVPVVSGSLNRETSAAPQIMSVLGRAWARGVAVDWAAVLGRGEVVDLPTYAFQRQRYWPSGTVRLGAVVAGGDGSGVEAEARFWAAVEGGDLVALAETLAVDGQRPFGEVLPQLAAWRRREQDRSVAESWRYRISWVPVPDPDLAPLTGTWLAVIPVGTAADLAEWCVRAMEDGGARVIITEAAGTADRTTLAEQISQALAEADEPPAGVLSLLALDEAPLPEHPVVPTGLAATLALVQALSDAGTDAPLWTATRGAVATGPDEQLPSPVQAMICGLARAAGLEYPERFGGLADLPAVLDERAALRLRAVLAGCGEDQIAIRPPGIMGRRLVHAPLPGRDRPAWTPSGTVLVTGGTGAIAGHVARWAARRGAPRMALTSRSGPVAPNAAGLAAELAAAGARVEVTGCDIADRGQVAGLLARIAADGPPLSSVMHTAGILDDGLLDGLGPDRLASVLAAKASGAAHLDELTADLDLDAFVLFSSIAAMFGASGQGNYAAANAFLDGLAQQRAAAGRAGLSVAYGPWAGEGVARSSEAVRQRLERGPQPPMDPRLAVLALDQAMAGRDSLLAVMNPNWPQLAAAPGAVEQPFVRDLPEIQAAAQAASSGNAAEMPIGGELARQLAGMSLTEQERMLTELIQGQAAEILGHASPAAVAADRAFADLGFDSLTTLEMRQRMIIGSGLRLPSTLLFDYPTPMALASFLRGELVGDLAAEPAAPTAGTAPAVADEPVAIVAMSCRYPGGVRSPEELWQLLSAGADAISAFPADRGWDLEALAGQTGTDYVREGGFVYDAAEFDPGFFGISPREALVIDPQQRLMLETCWEALERTGIDPRSLRGTRTGVFVGGYSSGYGISLSLAALGARGPAEQGPQPQEVSGNAGSVLSGRVSYTLGLEGPAVTVDTACSSALVALHMACQALRAGECSLALAGGVTIMANQQMFGIGGRRPPGQSADGRCKAFGATADGMGQSEGAGVLVVERLADARRHGHQVLAVVRGIAVNQDGASNGLTAPNGPAQQRVIRAALASAGLTADQVDAVEAHGTGTELGDPIEAHALLATYGQGRREDRPLWLGSVKSNLGHTQAAAGAAGVIKMVLALQHEELPRTLHAHEPSPHIDWDSGTVRLLTEPVAWPAAGQPRRAAVSAFGISGTNVHLILEEAPATAEETPAPDADAGERGAEAVAGPALPRSPLVAGVLPWVVSGRSAAGLAAQAGRLAAHLIARPGLDPADVAWSLAGTRSVFEYRAVVLGADREELTVGLGAAAAGQSSAAVVSGLAPAAAQVGFVFAGQGSQRAGMGRELHASSPAFAAAFDEACGLLEAELGLPVAEVVLAKGPDERADQTVFAQAGLFAVQAGLVALLAAAGIRPSAVAGHSVGEIAASYAAGVLSLPDACTLVAVRGRLMQALPGGGVMTAVEATEEEITAALAGVAGVSVAAVNGPSSVVISGDAAAVTQVAEKFKAAGRRVKALRVSHAFHSARMDPVLAELREVAAGLAHQSPRVPWACGVSGELMAEPGPGYWAEQARQPVRFADAVTALAAEGISVFVEIGPDGTLSAMGPEALGATADDPAAFVPVLRPGQSATRAVLAGLAGAYVHGIGVNWAAVLGSGRVVELPTYAFQRQRYWPSGTLRLGAAVAGGDGAGTEAEARFWGAVEGGDLAAVAGTLAVDAQRPFSEILPELAAWRRREQDRSVAESWRYRITWVPVPDPEPARLTGCWLVVALAGTSADPAGTGAAGPGGDLADWCARALEDGGAQVVTVSAEAGQANRAGLAELIGQALAGREEPLAGVISLLALDEAPLPDQPAVPAGLAATLALVQALGDAETGGPLWVLTSGAVTTGPGDQVTSPVQGMAWGLGRVAGLEHPGRWGGLADLPRVLDDRAAARLRAVLAGCAEDQVAIRPVGIMGRRLGRAGLPREGRPWTPSGTILVTGGTGAVAGHVARFAAGRGARRMVLASRSGPGAPGAATLASGLAGAGTSAGVIACDISDRGQVTGLLRRIAADGPPLSSVLHTAGVVHHIPIDETTTAHLGTLLTAKKAGAALLDELTVGLELDAFVVFSSIAATWGSGGQVGYAAANAFLDALTDRRRGRGLPATSVAWGAWGGGGMTDAESADYLRRRGVLAMDPQRAVGALAQALDAAEGPVTVADMDWARFAAAFTVARPSPLIGDLPEVGEALAAAEAEVGPGDGAALAGQLAGLSPAEQDRVMVNLVRTEAATVLGHASPAALEAGRTFSELGVDSLTAVELRNRLNAATGLRLPVTLMFDYPDPAALAGHLRTLIAADETGAPLALLTELDKLESMLDGTTAVDAESDWITARLEAVVSKWRQSREQAEDALTETGAALAEKIGSSSDDEVFDFLGKELGIYGPE